ncbi:phospholipase C [Chthonomonas calidirosea]|uniref:Phospholipase C n=1 Tax=Chthonomonas calidirosea (strain DSM 23976 / ICMP 18418 / T49) TaxID=1303518 RepID=S0EVF3_CHTCT|nr:alkaline phosphatase family protein [Chthonomonas calidirosea]CCW35396.1 Phospholipase C [Chthonomonas calidirosea T49]CEK20399.1 phospholipase C [Chthonomonas calidirosea]
MLRRTLGSVLAGVSMMALGLAFCLPQQNPLADVKPDPAIARYTVPENKEPVLSREELLQLVRKKIRYVFILYQENRSFDHYFGTFPGAEGLFSHPAAETPGFYQPLIGVDGLTRTIHPFRIGPAEFAADTDDVDHSHDGIVTKMHIVDGKPQMDRFALTEERRISREGNPSLKAVQFGELTMAYVDGDTVPFYWRYANRFVLFDHIFQQMTGPSTPGNLSIIAAQSGMTQWMLHPELAFKGGYSPGVPVLNDANPFWGSSEDKTTEGRMPYNPEDLRYPPQLNLTFATLPLSLTGKQAKEVTQHDRDPDKDLADVLDDVSFLSNSGGDRIPWGWFEEGFDKEPTDDNDADPTDAAGLHASYITHHNGPQYFGYIANNPEMSKSLRGLKDFFEAIDHRKLPDRGVFYVKGGYRNIFGMKPGDPDPKVQKSFLGDDDHPGYSDAQISEAMVAEAINHIAHSPYWKQCAIIITWDDSEGDYDHVPPPLRAVGPDGKWLSDGPRVPLIFISPFARTHAIIHEVGDTASVVKFVDAVFGLTPLADLPDEKKGRAIGEQKGLQNMGPFDDITPDITDLLSAFDPARLAGKAAALPPSYVEIPENVVRILPQLSGYGLRQIGIVPTDYRLGIKNEIPPDFNPRPGTNPTVPK